MQNRCPWPSEDKLMIEYHDSEWGMPLHDDIKLFEFMILDAFQAGLSWRTILHKREEFRKAFDDFDVITIANYGDAKINELLMNAGIVRNKLKIAATVNNAKCFLEVQKEFGTFDKYIWGFVSGTPIINKWTGLSQIPVKSAESDKMSKDSQKRGFKFVGSTICYAFMQAAGMVNDHLTDCPSYQKALK
jgi:DNA-3-methyladenine glycosylase I